MADWSPTFVAQRGAVDSTPIAAVEQRIIEIQARIAPLRPARSTADFSSVLAAATDASPAAANGRADHAHAAAPPELTRFGNGRIPAGELAPIGRGSHRLWAPAASGFRQLTQAAAADGVTIGVTDSYRSFDAQVDVARRRGLYSEGGLAAAPGTSNHGWGLSLDLDLDDRAQSWMRANADRFGFVEDVPREPWHWTFSPPSRPTTPAAESRPLALQR